MAPLSGMRDAKLGPNVISCNAGISAHWIGACGKGERWQRARKLLREMWEARLELGVISYNAGSSACEKSEQWQHSHGVALY